MFTAYFDESGTHAEASTVVVGGYVASIENWEKFENLWAELLSRESIKILHRTDMERLEGEFAGWDKARQIKTVQDANSIIKRFTAAGVGGAVIQSDFNDAMPGVLKRAFGGAYGWLVHESLVGIAQWAETNNCRSAIQFVFEAGAKGRRQVERMMSVLYDDPKIRGQLRLGGWSFVKKDKLKPLQCADWFAYELYKHMDNRVVAGPRKPIRKSALDLFRLGTDSAHYWDKQRLENWLGKAPRLIKMLDDRERALRSIGREDLI